jgi:hypothetical protein
MINLNLRFNHSDVFFFVFLMIIGNTQSRLFKITISFLCNAPLGPKLRHSRAGNPALMHSFQNREMTECPDQPSIDMNECHLCHFRV